MARKVNYEEKISAIMAKIEKKHHELKSLKDTLKDLKAQKADLDNQELIEYMQASNLTAADILAYIKA